MWYYRFEMYTLFIHLSVEIKAIETSPLHPTVSKELMLYIKYIMVCTYLDETKMWLIVLISLISTDMRIFQI